MQYCSPDGVTSSQIINIGDGMVAVDAVKDKAFENSSPIMAIHAAIRNRIENTSMKKNFYH